MYNPSMFFYSLSIHYSFIEICNFVRVCVNYGGNKGYGGNGG